jgi:Carboxypeptidase regulatory-like domain
MNRHILIVTILLIGSATSSSPLRVCAQASNESAAQKASEQQANSITGRVMNESGQPMPNASVSISGTGRQRPEHRNTSTDDDGKFRVDDLLRGVYSVSAQVRGYVMARDALGPTYYRPGDSVTLVLKKGGVITGTVTDSAGEPVVGVQVIAILLRDLEGHPTQGMGSGIPRYTDDRGVYRLFSLPAGVYVVAASSKLLNSSMPAFEEDAPTYYPSATRDTAAEVVVHSGSEVTGLDIRYRAESGHAISGLIKGNDVTGSKPFGVNVSLVRASSGAAEAQAYVQPRGNELRFGFYGVPDAEYYVIAQRYPYQNEDGASSSPVRVKVKGRDVTGVEIALVAFGSVAGRVILEPADLNEKSIKCKSKRRPSIEETLLNARRDQKEDPQHPPFSSSASMLVAPGDNGEFLLHGLQADHYRIETKMLDETWFVRAVTLPGTGRGRSSIDAGRNGFAVTSGQRVSGLTVVLAEGAASLRGRVVPEKEGALLPERLRVHLVPAEPEMADDSLRFAEAAVQSDGAFTLNNAAPGRYRLVARQASEEEANEKSPRPRAWNVSSRASLVRDAETLNVSIELKPCQRIADYQLRYTP